MQASFVPPPLYGYNTGESHGRASSQTSSEHSKKRRVHHLNDALWKCGTCQVYLESESALTAHTQAHITCSQCSFTASRKVVNGHFQAAHGKFSGGGFKTVTIAIPGCRVQRFNICVGNHPDDVKKWIEQRRQKFPRQRQTANQKEPDSALGSLLDGYGSSSSDDVCDEKLAAEKTANIVVKENNELSLPNVQKNGSSQQSRPANYRIRPCKYFMRNGSCRNGDACNFSHEIQNDARCNNNNKMNKRQKTKTSSSTTLLRKLLENDTKREATLSLQLLEYLVDCNYLQKQRNSNNDAT
jgi:hypothetical protein